MAYSNGDIAFNVRFINSRNSTYQLVRTLCHELAHLAAGLEAGHRKPFMQMNQRFSQQPLQKCLDAGHIDDQGVEFKQRVGYSFWLVAHLDNGDTVKVKAVHRRSKTYINYTPSVFKQYRIKQQTVASFDYIPYSE